jgi:hypothetical protein
MRAFVVKNYAYGRKTRRDKFAAAAYYPMEGSKNISFLHQGLTWPEKGSSFPGRTGFLLTKKLLCASGKIIWQESFIF